MTLAGPDAEDLRRSFLDSADPQRRAPGCPELEEYWEAQRGHLSTSRTRELVEHTVGCPSCAEAWRVAHAIGAMERGSARRRRPRAWAFGAAAAAVLLLAVGLVAVFPPGGPDAPVRYRSGQVAEIHSLMSEETPVPRADFLLRWSPGEEGTVYGVLLTTESFAPVASVNGLQRSEWIVPVEELGEIESGARLLWRVEALLPDGRKARSGTFIVRLE